MEALRKYCQFENEQGFTLIELLAVILIIGILVSIALPSFLLNPTNAAHDAEAKINLATTYHELHNTWPLYHGLTIQGIDDARASEPALYIINNSSYVQDVVAVDITNSNQAILRTVSKSGKSLCMIENEGANAGVINSWAAPTPPAACDTILPAPTPSMFGEGAAFAVGDLNINGSATITGSVSSNQNITISNNATVCGDAHPGPSGTVSGSVCDGYLTTPNAALINPPNVDTTAVKASNLDSRICGLDPCSGSVSFNPISHVLTLSNQGTLTLRGSGDYYFCSIALNNNTNLYIADNANLRIYIGSPEDCGVGRGYFTVGNNAVITNYNSVAGSMTVCMEGSPTAATIADIANGFQASTIFSLYGPRTDINIHNNTIVVGAFVGRTITMANSSQLVYDPTVSSATC